MPSTYRVTRIECPYEWLIQGDNCFHFGEYTSHGGYQASDTNRWIKNLKKKPTASQNELYYKGQAIGYWASVLAQLLPPAQAAGDVTFVPIPGSKPRGHADYDPRLELVLRRWVLGVDGVDIRSVLVQDAERPGQHEDGLRLTPDQIRAMWSLDGQLLASPLRSAIVVFDDVLTRGASFKAAEAMLSGLPGVQSVTGIFLARTVWPNPFANVADDF